jgi:predicted  nucleic acid-binding Zn-ribbon protein
MPKSHEERFDRLEALIEKGFAALAQDMAETKAEVAIVQTDVAAIKTEVLQIRVELKDIRDRLDTLESSVHSVSGFAKEIDHLLERVSAIEQHLGLRRNIAA